MPYYYLTNNYQGNIITENIYSLIGPTYKLIYPNVTIDLVNNILPNDVYLVDQTKKQLLFDLYPESPDHSNLLIFRHIFDKENAKTKVNYPHSSISNYYNPPRKLSVEKISDNSFILYSISNNKKYYIATNNSELFKTENKLSAMKLYT